MYSGDDSTGSSQYAQWSLNPTAYQNVSNDQVDWAALAQQWILMKEAGPPIPKPVKPLVPPIQEVANTPNINNVQENATNLGKNQWEPPSSVGENWSSSWKPSNWNNWNNWAQGPPIPNMGVRPPLLPNPKKFNDFHSVPIPDDVSNGKNRFIGPPITDPSDSRYWTSAGHQQQQFRPHNKRYSKVNVPRMPTQHVPQARSPVPPPIQQQILPPLDVNKRKQLPAWIREGLEKMEREKQKMMEKERETHQLEKINQEIDQNKKEKMELLKSTMKERETSKFDSEEDISDKEKSPKPIRRESPPRTREDMLLKVRRMMTQILLLVTDSQIKSIAKEEVLHVNKRKKYKASAQSVSAPRGANLSAKLGLSSYGSDSGSSSDSEGSSQSRDSDEDLKDVIKRKQIDFHRKEQLIEDKINEAQKRKTMSRSRSNTPAITNNDNHTKPEDNKKLVQIKQDRLTRSRSSPSSERSRNGSPKRNKSSSSDSLSDTRSRSYTPVQKSKRSRRSRSKEPTRTKDERRRNRSSESRSNEKCYGRQRSSGSMTSFRSKRSRSSSRDRYSTGSKRSRSRDRSKRDKSRRSRSHDRKQRSRSKDDHRRRRDRSSSYTSKKTYSKRKGSHRRRSHSSSDDDGKRSRRY